MRIEITDHEGTVHVWTVTDREVLDEIFDTVVDMTEQSPTTR